jgi:hypothetical protein
MSDKSCPKCGAERKSSTGWMCGTVDIGPPHAALYHLDESPTCLRNQLAQSNELLVHLYNAGYLAGHHDTVESTFVYIHNCDMDTYHSDVVEDLISDLAKRKGGGDE